MCIFFVLSNTKLLGLKNGLNIYSCICACDGVSICPMCVGAHRGQERV